MARVVARGLTAHRRALRMPQAEPATLSAPAAGSVAVAQCRVGRAEDWSERAVAAFLEAVAALGQGAPVAPSWAVVAQAAPVASARGDEFQARAEPGQVR